MTIPNHIRRFAVMYPSGNTTAVVFDNLLAAPRGELNDRIMQRWKKYAPDKPEIEQCCFVLTSQDPEVLARVEMFGGEFCGNATRSVIQLLIGGESAEGYIEVSGARTRLAFSIDKDEISVEMPLAKKSKIVQEVKEGFLIRLDGIVQLVVMHDALSSGGQHPRQLLESLLGTNNYGLKNEPAVGVSYYDSQKGHGTYAVWVKDVNTIFDETACGSGTSAIGIAMAHKKRTTIQGLNVLQPSGDYIRTDAIFQPLQNRVIASRISGAVTKLHDGPFDL